MSQTQPTSFSSKPRSRFYQFSLCFLAVEWIAFGSMHFSFHKGTVREIPGWIPFKDFIATTTGVLEVAAGMLILVAEPTTRKSAAILSLILLILLFPAMYNIVSFDETTLFMGHFAAPFRAILMPNNILMAICSIYIFYDVAEPRLTRSDERSSTAAMQRRIVRSNLDTSVLVVALVLLASNIAGFVTIFFNDVTHPTGYLWAMMCLALGAVVGFLFGVPKSNTRFVETSSLQTNSNVDAISDWLTKIIVGVGLINFDKIGLFIDGQSQSLAENLTKAGANPASKSFAEALIIFFFAAGLIEGYLLTRLFLGPEFGSRQTIASGLD